MSIDECPVSAVPPETVELLQHLARSRAVREGFGPSLAGPDIMDWPEWLVMACAIFENETAAYENALQEALQHRD